MTRDRVTIALPTADPAVRAAIVDRARRRGFPRFHDGSSDPVRAGPGEEVVVRKGDRLLGVGPAGGDVEVVAVGDEAALEAAARRIPEGGVLAIEWTGRSGDPARECDRRPGNAACGLGVRAGTARSPGRPRSSRTWCRPGVRRIRTPEEVDALEAIVEGPVPARLDWIRAPVSSVWPAGVGDRVLVDTTTLLAPEEGLLVGSAAAFLFHVASEAVGSKFSRPRPFRVNAGAAHSYVLMADGSTRYLSELGSGDAVLVTKPSGKARSARVGRIKIERRPLVVVTADDRGTPRTVFLQEAETVRLSTESGRVAATDAAAGLVVHAVRLPAARHLGRAVEETILER